MSNVCGGSFHMLQFNFLRMQKLVFEEFFSMQFQEKKRKGNAKSIFIDIINTSMSLLTSDLLKFLLYKNCSMLRKERKYVMRTFVCQKTSEKKIQMGLLLTLLCPNIAWMESRRATNLWMLQRQKVQEQSAHFCNLLLAKFGISFLCW